MKNIRLKSLALMAALKLLPAMIHGWSFEFRIVYYKMYSAYLTDETNKIQNQIADLRYNRAK